MTVEEEILRDKPFSLFTHLPNKGRIPEQLLQAQSRSLRCIDQVAGVVIVYLLSDPADIAANYRLALPEGLSDSQSKTLLG